MRKILTIIVFIPMLLCSFLEVTGQEQISKNDNKPYLFWGGAIWAGFGSYTYVDVNVIFGSQLTDRLNLGVIGKYQYHKDKRALGGNFETSVYGGSVFSQYAIVKDLREVFKFRDQSGIIAHVEYEFLNTKYNYLYFNVADPGNGRYWLNNLLVGGGYFQHMGERSRTFIILLWNLTESNDNPYTYPQLRIGFTISF